jgi:ribosomal protein L7/L12 domain protein
MNKKTILTTFLALAGVMWTTGMQAQTLSLFGTDYTDDTSIHLGGGTATWNKEEATLTLDYVKVEEANSTFIRCENIPLLKIVLVGENLVNSKWHTLYIKDSNVEITGAGSLTARSEVNDAIQQDLSAPHTLTIKDCKLDVQGKQRSILGYSKGQGTERLTLVIDNATVKVKGYTAENGATMSGIANLKDCKLMNCHVSMAGVKFGKRPYLTYVELIDTNNKSYPGEVTIVP